MNDLLTQLLDLVQSVDPVTRTILAGIGIMLETSVLIGLIVPGDTVVIVASTGVSGAFQWIAMIIVVIVGALIGESIGFGLGRWFGPKIRASKLGKRIGEQHWTRAEHYLDRRGGIAVFVSRFLPVLHSLIPLTVGMSTMSYRKFIAWTTPACIIWASAYVSVGAIAAGSYRELSDRLHWAGYIFVAIIAVFLVVALIVKKVLERSQERHMQRAGDGDANTMEEPDEPSAPSGPTA
ncbi:MULTISPECIES: DedA family protein [unclassified Plantibacter]|jgi:membrane-associated protein|uniref:DedA family protein n=1 Tax=unclassified Plantibacter TaxID=2624265 RepID=UPI003D3529B6